MSRSICDHTRVGRGRRTVVQGGIHRIKQCLARHRSRQAGRVQGQPQQPTPPGDPSGTEHQVVAPPWLGPVTTPEATNPSRMGAARTQVVHRRQARAQRKAFAAQSVERAPRREPARRGKTVSGQAEPVKERHGGREPQSGLVRGKRGELRPPTDGDGMPSGELDVVETMQQKRVSGILAMPQPGHGRLARLLPRQARSQQQRQRNPSAGQLATELRTPVECPGVDPGHRHHQPSAHPPRRADHDGM